MSVALMRIYDHFRHVEETTFDDESLVSAAKFAEGILGKNAVLRALSVTKTEAEFDEDDDELAARPQKKIRPDMPYTLDGPLDDTLEHETGPPLLFDWTARSSDGQQIHADEGQTALDVTAVTLDGVVTQGDRTLRIHVEFSGYYEEPTVTITIAGTSAEGFFRQWAQDTWQPQLEHLRVSEPLLVCSSKPTFFRHDSHCFFISAGISVILQARPGDNLAAMIKGPERLYLYGHLVDERFKDVVPYLKSYPLFELALGKSIRLTGCYFDISTRTLPLPERSWRSEDEEENMDEAPSPPIPFAQLNLAGRLLAPGQLIYLWTDVPADDEVLAFRQAGRGYQAPWKLDGLSPVLGDASALQKTFARGINGAASWQYAVVGLEYFHDLSSQSLYSLALQLELLDRDARIFPYEIEVKFERLILHCNIGAPDGDQAVSVWADGLAEISGSLMPFNMTWANGISMSAGNDGEPPESLYAALNIDPPLLPSEVVGLASYRVEFVEGRPLRLALMPLYRARGLDEEEYEDDEGPVLAEEPIILGQRNGL